MSVKVKEIDIQHQHLFGIINQLHDAMLANQSKLVVEKIFEELAAYTIFHFGIEEKYMLEAKFPGYSIHKKEHDVFATKVDGYMKRYKDDQLILSVDLVTYLRDWVTFHVKGIDPLYTGHFLKHGLK